MVVDAGTNAIYGHVVGANPIGEIYVSPYAAIFTQIQRQFPHSTIAIPEPSEALWSLIKFYSTFAHNEEDLQLLEHLMDLYKTTTHDVDGVAKSSTGYNEAASKVIGKPTSNGIHTEMMVHFT